MSPEVRRTKSTTGGEAFALLTDKEFAELMKWKVRNVYRRLAAGKSMPPFVKIPNDKNRLWKLSDIEQWIDKNKKEKY